MKISTYALLASAFLLLLAGAELVGVLSLLEASDVIFLAAVGGLLIWQGASQRARCKHVVGAIGALALLAGMLAPVLAVLSEGLVVSHHIGVEATLAVNY